MAAEQIYMVQNGANPTTAAPASVTTGTAIKTMLQVATPTTSELKVVAWGISFDGTAAATPIKVELLETDVTATGTAVTPTRWAAPLGRASVCTALHSASAEGTITATRELDVQLVAPTAQYAWEFSLGREPEMNVSKFLRIRVTAAAAVNAWCFIRWAE